MTCPCGDVAETTCHDCRRPLCLWHWAENLHRERVCYPSCASPYWGAAKSYEAVLSEVKLRKLASTTERA